MSARKIPACGDEKDTRPAHQGQEGVASEGRCTRSYPAYRSPTPENLSVTGMSARMTAAANQQVPESYDFRNMSAVMERNLLAKLHLLPESLAEVGRSGWMSLGVGAKASSWWGPSSCCTLSLPRHAMTLGGGRADHWRDHVPRPVRSHRRPLDLPRKSCVGCRGVARTRQATAMRREGTMRANLLQS